MNPETGDIQLNDLSELFQQQIKTKELIPFDNDEILEIKGCYFQIMSIQEKPANIVVLKGIKKEIGLRLKNSQDIQEKLKMGII